VHFSRAASTELLPDVRLISVATNLLVPEICIGHTGRVTEPVRIAYRSARADDADRISLLWSAANRARGGYVAEGDVAIVRGRITETDAVGYVAEDDGQIVGVAILSPARENRGRGDAIPGLAHLNTVAVASDLWGQGIARSILDLIVDHAHGLGYTQIQLYVDDDNTRARRLYERNDWNPTGEVARDEHVTHLRYLRLIYR
jgi:RimJ/RimL family protein N-acetyltransferase